tara:strand:- start:182 stop:469 length:288 start_codon:yes stop_codon:yes gene_type:complete
MEKTKFNHHHKAKITQYLTDNFDYGNWVKFNNESTLRNVVGDKGFESLKERIENHWFSMLGEVIQDHPFEEIIEEEVDDFYKNIKTFEEFNEVNA